MAPLAFHTVDAFTSTPFSGNPAAVLILPSSSSLTDTKLQSIAAEFNLSETAFASPIPSSSSSSPPPPAGEGHFTLRWFTPSTEVKLCGHATLATSHVLFSLHPSLTSLHFLTRRSGTLIATRLTSSRIQLDFPADVDVLRTYSPGEDVWEQALKVAESAAPGVKGRIVGVARTDGHGVLVEVEEGVDLERLEVSVSKVVEGGETCLTVTQKSTREGIDILSRFFAPGLGVPEDPVTGAAHCFLGPYWLGTPAACARLGVAFAPTELGQKTLRARQVSARGGEMDVSWDRKEGRIKLAGAAVTVMSGTLDC